MKFIFLLVVIFLFAVFSFYAFGFRQQIAICNAQYQDSLDGIVTQSQQTVFSDGKSACIRSYDVIMDWDLCLIQAENALPRQLLPWLRPVVSRYMMFFREKKKDMDVLKHENDERCKDYTKLMFYPPENE